MSQTPFECVQCTDGSFCRSLECIRLVHLSEKGAEYEVEDSREESERSSDDEQPVEAEGQLTWSTSRARIVLTIQLRLQTKLRELPSK